MTLPLLRSPVDCKPVTVAEIERPAPNHGHHAAPIPDLRSLVKMAPSKFIFIVPEGGVRH